MLNEGEIITLDNQKEYVLIKKISLKKEYLYLITINKPIETMICFIDLNGDLITIDSKEEIKYVLKNITN